jgi:transposase InsO family protein
MDNALAENVIKTLKDEEVHLFEDPNFVAARGHIGQYLAEVSNENRLLAALGDRPPAAFERWLGPYRCA